MDTVTDNLKKVREENGLTADAMVPSDLVLASGSGLDPHLSPAAAYIQVERVARERGLAAGDVRRLVDGMTEERQWGIFGEPRVNVLKLNLALDALTR
jgi:K+-transporting ATPase, c chain